MQDVHELLARGHNLQHFLAALLLLGRLGDVGSTYLATPNLVLEGNPLMRRGRWRLALLSVGLCFVPYWNTSLALVVLVASLLVTSSNLSKGWLMRALGEQGYLRLIREVARRSSLREALAFTWGAAGATALAGAVLMVFSDGERSWPYWFALGMLAYAGAVALYGTLSVRRLFARVRAEPADSL